MTTAVAKIEMKTNGNDEAAHVSDERATGNGVTQANTTPEATEGDGLLSVQVVRKSCDPVAETQRKKSSTVYRVREQLDEVICWKVKLWMVIVIIFFIIIAVIFISLALCSLIYEDVDEKYDTTSYNISRSFNGSFRLPNQVFKQEPLNQSYNEGNTLTKDLQKMMVDVYTSSPALGRYFSEAKIYAFSYSSAMADYQLTFRMPADWQVMNIILSKEMVYNVFRQYLYDQETKTEPMYIDPGSLEMSEGS